MSAIDLHQQNKEQLKKADDNLDKLENMTGTMVHNAKDINTEIRSDINLIDKINDKMDKADDKVVEVTNAVNKQIEKTTNTLLPFIINIVLILLGIGMIAFSYLK